jgi:hypothetical protein
MIQDVESTDAIDVAGTTVVPNTNSVGGGVISTTLNTPTISNIPVTVSSTSVPTNTIPSAQELTVSDAQVRAAFSYSPDFVNINYIQYYGDPYIEVPITVTNNSNTFALRIYPDIANQNISVYASGSTNDTQPLNSTSAFILQSGSTKDLIVREITKKASTTKDGYEELRKVGIYADNLSFVVTAVALETTQVTK